MSYEVDNETMELLTDIADNIVDAIVSFLDEISELLSKAVEIIVEIFNGLIEALRVSAIERIYESKPKKLRPVYKTINRYRAPTLKVKYRARANLRG